MGLSWHLLRVLGLSKIFVERSYLVFRSFQRIIGKTSVDQWHLCILSYVLLGL